MRKIIDKPKSCLYCTKIIHREDYASDIRNRQNWIRRKYCGNSCSRRAQPLKENPEYSSLHHWIRRRLGTPMLCENCGTNKASTYDWANISGKYTRNLDDWARLCRICHTLIDDRKPIYKTYLKEMK